MSPHSWARPLYRIGQVVGTLAVITIALLTAADVVLRYFFNAAIFACRCPRAGVCLGIPL